MNFVWPEGKRAALSLTFDDARPSQINQGLPILNAHGVRATFYVTVSNLQHRLDDWCSAQAVGHEIGGHTLTHPCSGNFRFARSNPLEEYTLARMEEDLTAANVEIERMVGIPPTTFAYPCGQKFVGRGVSLQSYVPLVARHYMAGRGFRDEGANDPEFCDPSQLFGMEADGVPLERMNEWIDRALAEGHWLVLVAHDVGTYPSQAIAESTLDEICRYAADPTLGLWIDSVQAIASWIDQARGPSTLRNETL